MKAIFLDRDGVINRTVVKGGRPYPPSSLAKLEIFPGVKAALKSLHKAGYLLIIVTNQPDVARGTTPKAIVDEIHKHMLAEFPIEKILCCFHDNKDNCECRKPKPGLIFVAAENYNLVLSECYMIGDRWRDIDAGLLAGCKTIFIDYGYAEKQPEQFHYKVRSLYEASKIILGED